jgi:protein gp37
MTEHGTAIEWTQAPGYKGEIWNPVTGCNRVSPGCANCYALDLAARLKGMGQKRYQRDGDPKTSGPGFGLTLHPDKLEEPLRWRKPRMVFVNSMSDLFHEAVPDDYIAELFAVMSRAPQHVFQVLTKRPERARDLLADDDFVERVSYHRAGIEGELVGFDWPLSNVWAGTSIENRRFVHRADLLRETPAAVRFVSAEPLLGPLVCDDTIKERSGTWPRWSDGATNTPQLRLDGIDWLIVGGESGPSHRRMDPQWVRDLHGACLGECLCCTRCPVGECEQIASGQLESSRTAFFVKQGSSPRPGHQGDIPDDLWAYKEFPATVAGEGER